MTHPLDLPEVRRLIAQLLTPHDLTVCSRISRDWNQTCDPLLWRKLGIAWSSPYHRIVEKTSIRSRSHHVKSLNCGESYKDAPETVASVISDIYFRHLEDLTWSAPSQDQAKFTHCHRLTLVHLDLSYEGERPDQRIATDELWPVIEACQMLRTLKINRVSVTQATWSTCWSLWLRLTALHLTYVDFSQLNVADDSDEEENTTPPIESSSLLEWLAKVHDPCQQPLRIKTLELTKNMYTWPEDELAIMTYCPDLETLIWEAIDTIHDLRSEQLEQQLAEQARHCPKMVNVNLLVGRETCDPILPFLETKVGLPLQELNLSYYLFGQADWDLVRTKHTSLRTLDLWDADLSNGLAHSILCSLPANIESLSVRSLEDQHILDDPRPWIGLSLKSLSLGVNVVEDPLEGQDLIMRQIAMLKNLNYLKVLTDTGVRQVLLFRLATGLGHLVTLQDLRELVVNFQRLTEEDVRWMVDNWPRLSSVLGFLNPSPAITTFLWSILRERGVVVRPPNYDIEVC